jgi:hypothetical protein
MRGTAHALAGGLAGALAGRPVPAFLAGMAMHAGLDILPHRDEEDPPLLHLAADVCGVLAVLALAVMMGNFGMAAGVIGGVIPDVENVPDVLFKRKFRKVFPSHWFEHALPPGSRWGALESAVLIAAAVGLAVVLWGTGLRGVLRQAP